MTFVSYLETRMAAGEGGRRRTGWIERRKKRDARRTERMHCVFVARRERLTHKTEKNTKRYCFLLGGVAVKRPQQKIGHYRFLVRGESVISLPRPLALAAVSLGPSCPDRVAWHGTAASSAAALHHISAGTQRAATFRSPIFKSIYGFN